MSRADNPAEAPGPLPAPTLAQAEQEEGRIGYGRYARYSPLGLALLVLVVLAGVWWWQSGDDGEEVGGLTGKTAPDVELTTFDGATVRLAELRGSVVVVNFWAASCAPCTEAMPAMQNVFEQTMLTGEPVVFLGVDLKSDRPEDAVKVIQDLGLTYIIGPDDGGDDPLRGPIQLAFGIANGAPATFFVRPDGVIDALRIGPMEEKELRERMKHAAD